MISIVITTFNRPDVLARNLETLKGMQPYDKEILVVDNGRSEDTRAVCQRLEGRVQYIPMVDNIGCAARNAGIRAAQGDIVVTLDDDVLFSSQKGLEMILDFFRRQPEAAAVNFKIIFEDDKTIIPFNWFHPRDYQLFADQEFETDYISEGAVAFRREVFDKAGFYPAEFFISHEGPDLAYRIIDRGFKIFYCPHVEVIHLVSRLQRASWRNSYYDTRNQIWLGVRNFPLGKLFNHLVYRSLTTFVFCAARMHLRWYFKAMWDGFAGLPRQLAFRKPISPATLVRIREIRRFRPSIYNKIIDFIRRMKLVKRYYS